MSLAIRLSDLTTRISTEVKALRTLLNGNATDLAALTTTAKTTLVAAVNEVNAKPSGGAAISDTTTATTTTWSSTKTDSEITAARVAVKSEILGSGVPAALDTLDELAAALGDDANFAATTTTALGNRVRVDTAAQGLTTTQQSNARTNIAAAGSVEVGDVEQDLVAVFNAGLV